MVQRPSYSPEELKFNALIRSMLNHRVVLEKIAAGEGPAIICEGDFVPCKGIGSEPYPIPDHLAEKSWVWLYSNRPVLKGEIFEHAFEGHSNAPVCYLATQLSAITALKFMDETMSKRDPKEYYDWDNFLPKFASKHGITQLIANRSLGEHGGIPSKVHTHRNAHHVAEVLMGPLYFLPIYADGSGWKFILSRVSFKMLAFARVFTFRTAPKPYLASLKSQSERLSAFRFVLTRLLTPY